jgi:hypothetical protein
MRKEVVRNGEVTVDLHPLTIAIAAARFAGGRGIALETLLFGVMD